jgi:hypothetical protein
MTIYAPRPEVPGFCDEYLRFPDDVELGVTASPSEPDSQVDVCPAAEALARAAAAQIAAGRITHREFPPGSVGLSGPSALCTVETGLNPAAGGPAGQVEIALVNVRVPTGGTAKACGAATSVAATVRPKLPPAH